MMTSSLTIVICLCLVATVHSQLSCRDDLGRFLDPRNRLELNQIIACLEGRGQCSSYHASIRDGIINFAAGVVKCESPCTTRLCCSPDECQRFGNLLVKLQSDYPSLISNVLRRSNRG